MRFKLTIFMLFAISELFAQGWIINDGFWISPVNKNSGVQKSLQVGDGVGNDSLLASTGTVIYLPQADGGFLQNSAFSFLARGSSSILIKNDSLTVTYNALIFNTSTGSAFAGGIEDDYGWTINDSGFTFSVHNLEDTVKHEIEISRERIMIELVNSLGAHITSLEQSRTTGLTIQADDTVRMQFDVDGAIKLPNTPTGVGYVWTDLGGDGEMVLANNWFETSDTTIKWRELTIYRTRVTLGTTDSAYYFQGPGGSKVVMADNGAVGFIDSSGTSIVLLNSAIYISTTEVSTTDGDAETINSSSGRFRKDTSGATFTLTNSVINANSIIILCPANNAIDASATTWTVSAGVGSAVITFNAAPTSNFDMNFWIIN